MDEIERFEIAVSKHALVMAMGTYRLILQLRRPGGWDSSVFCFDAVSPAMIGSVAGFGSIGIYLGHVDLGRMILAMCTSRNLI